MRPEEPSEAASLPLELGRRSYEVPLAELDAALTQDVVGSRGMKIEVRQAEVQQQNRRAMVTTLILILGGVLLAALAVIYFSVARRRQPRK